MKSLRWNIRIGFNWYRTIRWRTTLSGDTVISGGDYGIIEDTDVVVDGARLAGDSTGSGIYVTGASSFDATDMDTFGLVGLKSTQSTSAGTVEIPVLQQLYRQTVALRICRERNMGDVTTQLMLDHTSYLW